MMKQYLKLSFGIFIAGTLSGPAAFAQRKPVSPVISISGKINLDENHLAILSDLRGPTKEAIEIPISKTGTFNWKSDNKSVGFLRMSFIPKSRKKQLAAIFPLYVQKGSQLKLNLNYSDSTYLTILPGKLDGDNKALIEYSNFCFLKMRDLFKNRPSTEDKIKEAITPYITKADDLIAAFGVKSTTVKQYLDVWAMNNYIGGLLTLPRQLQRSGGSKELAADYYTFPKSPAAVYNQDVAVLLNETNMNVNQYLAFLNKGQIESKDAFEQLSQKFKQLDALFTNKVLISNIVAGSLDDFTRKFNMKPNGNFEEELAKYKALTVYVKDEKKRAELEHNFKNLKYTLNGATLPDIAFKDVNGKDVKLQSFAGKYIYIDLWASWCKPCIAEIPNLHKLEHDYKDKNIVFVSISLDMNKNDWRKKMEELKLQGHQWELGDSAYDKLMNVSGIPHFLLYDPIGKLVMYKAPRPGATQIRTFFDQSLSSK